MSSKTKSKSKGSTKASGKSKISEKLKRNVAGPEARSSKEMDFGSAMKSTIREEDIKRIASIQNRSLRNFSKTNELLGKFNDFSSSKYDVLQHMFVQHTRMLVELKSDLTNVFSRIRRLKVKLQRQYPEAFEATFNLRQVLDEELEQEEPSKPTYDAQIDIVSERKKETQLCTNEENGSSTGLVAQTPVTEETTLHDDKDLKINDDENLESGCDVEVTLADASIDINTSPEQDEQNNEDDIEKVNTENEKLYQESSSQRLSVATADESCRVIDDVILVENVEVKEPGDDVHVEVTSNVVLTDGPTMKVEDNVRSPGVNEDYLHHDQGSGKEGANSVGIIEGILETGDDIGIQGTLEGNDAPDKIKCNEDLNVTEKDFQVVRLEGPLDNDESQTIECGDAEQLEDGTESTDIVLKKTGGD